MNLSVSSRPSLGWFPLYAESQVPDTRSQKDFAPADDVRLGDQPASFWTDLKASGQFAVNGLLYKNAGKRAEKTNLVQPPLLEAPRVSLEDPLVIVPGWSTVPEKFDQLVGHLTAEGANGGRAVYLKQGQAYSDKACLEPTEIQNRDRVFVTVFETTVDAPDVSAPQLEKAIAAVKASGLEKIDVLGYSMGGLSVRKMLDDGKTTLDQVALLGTANQGTRFGALAGYIVRRDINWAMSLGGINGAHLPAMDWLRTLDPQNSESNPALLALNENLGRQLSHASEFLSIGSKDMPTAGESLFGRVGGDGLVPASSVSLPGVATKLLEGKGNKHHGNLPHDADVFNTLTEYYDWTVQG